MPGTVGLGWGWRVVGVVYAAGLLLVGMYGVRVWCMSPGYDGLGWRVVGMVYAVGLLLVGMYGVRVW